jgi:hypothetical protein
LIKAEEFAMATPLAMKAIECLTARQAQINESTCELLLKLVGAFGTSESAAADARVQRLLVSKAACKLAVAPRKGANPALEQAVMALHASRAVDLAAAGQLGDAARHFAMADQPDQHARLLQRWAALGYAGERDLFAVRAVLHTLALSTTKAASGRRLYAELVANGMLAGGGTEGHGGPLEHFLILVFELLDLMASYVVGKQAAAGAFATFLKSYHNALLRDQGLMPLAQRVGQVHFGWIPPPSPMQGLMDMFKS